MTMAGDSGKEKALLSQNPGPFYGSESAYARDKRY